MLCVVCSRFAGCSCSSMLLCMDVLARRILSPSQDTLQLQGARYISIASMPNDPSSVRSGIAYDYALRCMSHKNNSPSWYLPGRACLYNFFLIARYHPFRSTPSPFPRAKRNSSGCRSSIREAPSPLSRCDPTMHSPGTGRPVRSRDRDRMSHPCRDRRRR